MADYGTVQCPIRSTFRNWILSIIISILLPSASRTLNPLLKFKYEFDSAVDSIEGLAVVVEKVAAEVEKTTAHMAKELPEGGELRRAMDFIESMAEIASKDARVVEELIHRVEEAEEKLEECFQTLAAIEAPGMKDDHHTIHHTLITGSDHNTQ